MRFGSGYDDQVLSSRSAVEFETELPATPFSAGWLSSAVRELFGQVRE